MKKILVTGGAGFIGSHLTEILVRQGFRVTVLDNLSTGRPGNLEVVSKKIRWVRGDVRDRKTVAACVKGQDAVCHLAAVSSVARSLERPRETYEINVLGTVRLLEASRRAAVKRFIFSSSAAVYGDAVRGPAKENAEPKALSFYADTKIAAERLVALCFRRFGFETVVLRYFNVYGLRQNPASDYSGVVTLFVNRLKKGQPPVIFGDGRQTRDFVHVRDAVAANLLALRVPQVAGEIFNIASGHSVRILDLASHLASFFPDRRGSSYLFQRKKGGDVRYSAADIHKASRLLGYRPSVPLAEGLRDFFLK